MDHTPTIRQQLALYLHDPTVRALVSNADLGRDFDYHWSWTASQFIESLAKARLLRKALQAATMATTVLEVWRLACQASDTASAREARHQIHLVQNGEASPLPDDEEFIGIRADLADERRAKR